MARPRKQTVDYFPHSCIHRKTIFVIEQRYGNNGYAFWFKLLELLGQSDGHYIDFNDEATWEFLQAKTQQNNGFCAEILDLLAKLGAIDAELWQYKIVWSQNFVNGIADVYRNRRVDIPSRPSFYIHKPVGDEVSTSNLHPEIHKLKETKLKETKGEGHAHLLNNFNVFWEAYPRKQAKVDAERAFKSLNPSEDLLAVIIADIISRKQSEAWLKDNGKYIPLPASYLRGKRWEDEIKKEVPNGKDRRYPEEKHYPDPDSYRLPVILSTDPAILKLHAELKGEKAHPPEG